MHLAQEITQLLPNHHRESSNSIRSQELVSYQGDLVIIREYFSNLSYFKESFLELTDTATPESVADSLS